MQPRLFDTAELYPLGRKYKLGRQYSRGAIQSFTRRWVRGGLGSHNRHYGDVQPRLRQHTESINSCNIKPFRRYIGALLIKVGRKRSTEELVAALKTEAQRLEDNGSIQNVKLDYAYLADPAPGMPCEEFIVHVSFLKSPPAGISRSGQYKGTYQMFLSNCIIDKSRLFELLPPRRKAA